MKVQDKETGRILSVAVMKEYEDYIFCIDTVEPFLLSKNLYKVVDA